MPHDDQPALPTTDTAPQLNALVRERLGRQLRAIYEPVIDEALDPRLAELMQQLDSDRQGEPTA